MKNAKLVAVLIALSACGGGNGNGKGAAGPSSPGGGGKISAANSQYTTGEQVIEASLAAVGGREKLSKITAMKTTATMEMAMGMKGKVTIVNAPPRSSLTTVDLPGLGKILQGTRDDVAWEIVPMTGARVYKGPERATALREATFNSDVNWKELYGKADLAGVVEFQGVKAYKVTLTPKDGGDPVTRYYAQDTLLPVGYETKVKSQMGEVAVSAFESDYREVGGIKFAHKIKRKDVMEAEVTVESIELSPVLDPSTFDLPDEIKKLVK